MAPGTQTDAPSSEELILGFLAEAGEEFTSGEAISNKLGLSRTAVWKNVESLRGKGYVIEAVPARGYRLVEIPDRLTELELSPLLNTHDFGRTLHALDEVGSTSDEASQLALEGAEHGETVVAEMQTSGRGRRGRAWVSPPGKNLYLSIVLRPELPPQRAPELTFVAAVAVAETLIEANVPAQIKWPNDIVVEDKKVAGILTELHAEPERVQAVILGIGVNLNLTEKDLPSELRAIATSALLVRGASVPRALFTAALLARLEHWYDRHAEEGFEPICARWRELTCTLDRQVRVSTGGKELIGVAQDVDNSGALMVAVGDELVRVVAGDVELLRPV
ncbi:MAG: biotin--[acetyl-CoA-carboxylase] ligase [Deltaproteobacteria bacterium]|nr:biotin--[acetyl-CoA-carboxylase] ligase [Deltaproteobacteria bacterium]